VAWPALGSSKAEGTMTRMRSLLPRTRSLGDRPARSLKPFARRPTKPASFPPVVFARYEGDICLDFRTIVTFREARIFVPHGQEPLRKARVASGYPGLGASLFDSVARVAAAGGSNTEIYSIGNGHGSGSTASMGAERA
jgi:hypothetical protein